VVCLSDLGFTVSATPGRKGPLGQHGFDPELPEMHGLFMASGYRLKHLELDLIENLEVYPFLCELLGIKEQPNDSQHVLKNTIAH